MSETGGLIKKRKRPAGAGGATLQAVKEGSADWESEGSGVVESPVALDELMAWRKMKRATGGIDLDKLNSGGSSLRATPELASGDAGAVKQLDNGMLEGTDGGLKVMSKETNKILKSDSFTGQTNIVDVNKHMMAYVEAQMKKKKEAQEAGLVDADGDADHPSSEQPQQPGEQSRYALGKLPGSEGNVTSSTGMLTSIPEVDLGIDSKLRNIQETEKARRSLLERQSASSSQSAGRRRGGGDDDDALPAERFYKHRTAQETDSDALARARREALKTEQEMHAAKRQKPQAPKRQVATDDQVMDRFKKRMGGKK